MKSGRTVAEVAAGLDVTEQTIYNWRNQELIDTGQKPGLSSIESVELAAARRRIAQLETEVAIATRSTELLKSVAAAKAVRSDRSDGQRRTARADGMPGSGGVRVRFLRVTKPATLGTLIATCLAGTADHRGSNRLPWHLRRPACSRKNSPLVTALPWDTAASNS